MEGNLEPIFESTFEQQMHYNDNYPMMYNNYCNSYTSYHTNANDIIIYQDKAELSLNNNYLPLMAPSMSIISSDTNFLSDGNGATRAAQHQTYSNNFLVYQNHATRCENPITLMPNGHTPQPDTAFLFNNMQEHSLAVEICNSNKSPQEHHVDDLLNMQLYSAVHTTASENSTPEQFGNLERPYYNEVVHLVGSTDIFQPPGRDQEFFKHDERRRISEQSESMQKISSHGESCRIPDQSKSVQEMSSHNEGNILLEQSKNMQGMFSRNEGRSMSEQCKSVQKMSSHDEGCTKLELLNSIQEISCQNEGRIMAEQSGSVQEISSQDKSCTILELLNSIQEISSHDKGYIMLKQSEYIQEMSSYDEGHRMFEQFASTQEISSHDEGHRMLEQSENIQEMSSQNEGHGMFEQSESTQEMSSHNKDCRMLEQLGNIQEIFNHDESHRMLEQFKSTQEMSSHNKDCRMLEQSEHIQEISSHDEGHRMLEQFESTQEVFSLDKDCRMLEQLKNIQEIFNHDESRGMLEQSESTQEMSNHNESHRMPEHLEHIQEISSHDEGHRMLEQFASTHKMSSHDEGHTMLEQSEHIQEMSSHDEGHRMLEQSESTQDISSHDEGHRILEQPEYIQEMSNHDEGHGMLEQSESTQEMSSHYEGGRILEQSEHIQEMSNHDEGHGMPGQSERVHEISDHDKGHRMPEQSERIQGMSNHNENLPEQHTADIDRLEINVDENNEHNQFEENHEVFFHSEVNNNAMIGQLDVQVRTENLQLILEGIDAVNNSKCTGRKRKRDFTQWQNNVRMKSRLEGLPYMTRRKKIIEAKQPKQQNCDNCRYKCTEMFTEEQRNKICETYYNLGVWLRQNDFICSRVTENSIKTRKVIEDDNNEKKRSKRTNVHIYSFEQNSEDIRVCERFFCTTLAISNKRIARALRERANGVFIGSDKRKGKCPKNKLSEEQKNLVKKHINEFPRMDPHYCRKDTNLQYLSPELNVSKMYHLYCNEFCIRENIRPVKLHKYREIFVTDYNLKFFIPKKDQCSQCNAYKNGTVQYKDENKVKWDDHKRREKEAMDHKALDKQKAAEELNFKSIAFDLQAVLYTPHAGDSQIYYKRKLAAYNFTIYEHDSKDGYCFLWDETEGKRGAAEISSILLKYLQNLPKNVNHITSFSDTCAGQNRNRFITATMMYAVQTLNNINTIDLKYMESGHSYLEADAMHATIEAASRHLNVYTTREWELVIKTARRRPRPFIVTVLNHADFFDVKKLATDYIRNTTKTVENKTVNWLNIKWLRFEKSKPQLIQFKYNLSDPEFQCINVGIKLSMVNYTLCPIYNCRIGISKAKKNDLLSLLKSKIIPERYTDFYKYLPVGDVDVEILPEPSADEDVPTIENNFDENICDEANSEIVITTSESHEQQSAIVSRPLLRARSQVLSQSKAFNMQPGDTTEI